MQRQQCAFDWREGELVMVGSLGFLLTFRFTSTTCLLLRCSCSFASGDILADLLSPSSLLRFVVAWRRRQRVNEIFDPLECGLHDYAPRCLLVPDLRCYVVGEVWVDVLLEGETFAFDDLEVRIQKSLLQNGTTNANAKNSCAWPRPCCS
jgi:hypothetical protein